MDSHDELQIDQALFGYSDGHRQLAASLLLPSRDMYELAARSDMEPGASISGDRTYVSGFPLTESRAFAVVKTWPAPEMPRPGCVWSHVLLLPRKFLSTQVNLGVLKGFLKRPDGTSDYRKYEKKLTVRRFARSAAAAPSTIATIIASYYDDLPVILSDTPDEDFERALFDVWSQQWPRLRSEFAFRTVLTTAAPPTKDLIIKVEFGGNVRSPARGVETKQGWIRAALDDAVSPTITPLRRFLWRYGKDLSRPKRGFKVLVQLHLASRFAMAGTSLETAAVVFRQFPRKTDALTLKRDLIGTASNALALMPRIRPADYAAAIVRWKALADDLVREVELRDAISRFDRKELVQIASSLSSIAEGSSREAEVMLDTVIDLLDGKALEEVSIPYDVILLVLHRRPGLLVYFDIGQIEASDAIRLLDVSDDDRAVAKLLRRVLTGCASDVAVAAVRSRAMTAFKEAVILAASDQLHPDWSKIFPRYADSILKEGLDESVEGVALVAQAILILDFPIVSHPSAADWHWRAGPAYGDPTPDRTVIDAYLLVLCLHEGIGKTMMIVADVLPGLRSQALKDALPGRVKALLDANLPHRYESWDLNRRLLKILKRAHRSNVDILPALLRLRLPESELQYVFGNDEEATALRLLARIFWPFY